MSEGSIRQLAELLLVEGAASLSVHDRKMLERIAQRAPVARDINHEFDSQLTFGERLSDKVAEIGGSWSFIIGFACLIVGWMIVNSILLIRWGASFDAYPFIFLNFLLSLVAALQAPIIMMSQNRQSDRDRFAARQDYEVNLKAEIEIAALHDKIEQMRTGELGAILARIETLLERRIADDVAARGRSGAG